VLTIGTVLDGRYEILAPIAEGGMGAVYRARRTLLGDEVAVKIMQPDFGSDPGSRERFLRESRACAQLRHPNIVSILDYNLDPEGRPFLVMELLNGRSLREEVIDRGPLSLVEMQLMMTPLCAALQLAHERGVLHRDLKPANIVAHDFGGGTRTHKIVDFGLARVRESTEATRLTGAHQFLGTIAYAAPEQLAGGIVDARSDIYSLGVVIFEALTGRLPFEGNDAMMVLSAVMSRPAPAPSSIRKDLPAWVDIVLGRALAKAPEDRYDSMSTFAADLQSAHGSDQATMIQDAPPGRTAGGLLATYDVGRRLGPGRMGSEVFLGTHRALGHPVALRLLRREPERDWNAVRGRLLREAKALQIAHPSIIHVRDYGEEGDLIYVVTDYIEGRSLREIMRADGPMPWTRLRPLLAQLIEAAGVLHRRHGLLCGMSPDIMRITPDDEAERLMISSAGIWQAQDLLATLHAQTLRGAGLEDSELHYIAPELLTGESASVASDIFTMAVLAYEMATGELPYQATSMPGLLGKMLGGTPRDPRELQPTLPAATAAAIVKALAPSPGQRFQSAREFGRELLG